MRQRKLLALGLAAVLCVLSACGKEEIENQKETDRYVYVPETLKVPSEGEYLALENIKATDSYLYYKLSTTTETQICRIPLEDEPDFTAGESLLQSVMVFVDYTVDQEHNLYVPHPTVTIKYSFPGVRKTEKKSTSSH